MIGHASEWLAAGLIPFLLLGVAMVALCLIALLRRAPFEGELWIWSLLCLKLRTQPTRDEALEHRQPRVGNDQRKSAENL
jgi:hypothetical protein